MSWGVDRISETIKSMHPEVLSVKVAYLPEQTIRIIVIASSIKGLHQRIHKLMCAVLPDSIKKVQVQVIRGIP